MSDVETDGIDTVDLVEMPKETFTPTKGIAQTEGDIDEAKKQIAELQQRILLLEQEEQENENEHSELLREHAMLLQEKQEEHLKYLRQRMAMEEQQYNDEVSGRRLMEAEIEDASQQDIEGHFAAELRYLEDLKRAATSRHDTLSELQGHLAATTLSPSSPTTPTPTTTTTTTTTTVNITTAGSSTSVQHGVNVEGTGDTNHGLTPGEVDDDLDAFEKEMEAMEAYLAQQRAHVEEHEKALAKLRQEREEDIAMNEMMLADVDKLREGMAAEQAAAAAAAAEDGQR